MSTAPSPSVPRWLELGSYTLVAIGAVLPAILSGEIIGDGVDLFGTFWFYWWIQECIASWSDPGFTQLFFFPLGKDIFAHTGNNFVDALLAQPFQYVIGYPTYQPWFIGFLLLANGLCFRPLARHVLGTGPAAWGATLLWMVAPYALFEFITGRLTQATLLFIPLAIYHFLRIGEGRKRDPVLAGLWTGVAGWAYWFNGYFVVFVMAWLAVVALIKREHPRRTLLLGWLIAGLTCLLVIGPAYSQMSGLASSGDVPGLSEAGSIFMPPEAVSNNVAPTLHGYFLMESVGHPMFSNLIWGGGLAMFVLLGRQRLRWLGFILVTLLIGVGPVLDFGEQSFVLPYYMAAYHYLPFFDRLWFPYRILGVTFVGVAIGIGTLIRRVEHHRLAVALPLLLTAVTLVEQNEHLTYPLLSRDLTPPAVYSHIGQLGGALIEAPLGVSRSSIAYQPVHGQPTFGGMGESASVLWPDGYRRRLGNTFIQYVKYITRDPVNPRPYKDNHLATLKAEGYRWLILDRRLVDSEGARRSRESDSTTPTDLPFKTTAAIIDDLGLPWAVDGELVVWDLVGDSPTPIGLEPTDENLTVRTWEPETMPEYESHLREMGRLP